MEGGRYFRTGAYEKEKREENIKFNVLYTAFLREKTKKIPCRLNVRAGKGLLHQNFFQVPLKKSRRSGKISRRPASISKIRTHLDR